MSKPDTRTFDPLQFLTNNGLGHRTIHVKAKALLFAQGQPADSIFYLQHGRAKLTVVSAAGKEAIITLLATGDFFGEEALAGTLSPRLATARAISQCSVHKIMKSEMVKVLKEQPSFSELFLAFLVGRTMRIQADLVDQLFNNSEKRLARILLLMADFATPGDHDDLLPAITQDVLAEMVGTTRSRVSFFMNRFRKLGFIEYNGRIRVNKGLLNIVLHDQVSGDSAVSAPLISKPLKSQPAPKSDRSS